MGWAGGRGGCLSCYSKPGWGVLGCNTVLVKYIVTIVGVALKMGTCTFHVRCSGAMLKMRMTVLSWHSPGIASHPHHIAYILQIWKQHLKQCFEKYRLELWRECFFHDDTTKWTPACHMISDSLNVLQVLQVRRKSFLYIWWLPKPCWKPPARLIEAPRLVLKKDERFTCGFIRRRGNSMFG